MNPNFPGQFSPMMPPALPPLLPFSSSFWNSANVRDRLKDLSDTFEHAKALEKELEMFIETRKESDSVKGDSSIDAFRKCMEDNRINLEFQERISLEAVNSLISRLRDQLEPFRVFADERAPWEEKSAAVRFANKTQKFKRNKLWRKRKRKQIAEKLAKERDEFEQVDKEADEWRAIEIAKDYAKLRVEKMKEIAKLKAKEERKKLESELELMLIVEKLQELRSIRIQKLKKQGHFLPEEDDKFLERVRAAVEEEERQVLAAADTEAAKDAIASAEGSRMSIQCNARESEEHQDNKVDQDHLVKSEDEKGSGAANDKECREEGSKASSSGNPYNSMSNLPMEFYHYYYGSNTDMGTLIEVRRMWDAYIRPGGSRIPGHWVQPPPPSNEIWASYLVNDFASELDRQSESMHIYNNG